MFTFKTSINMFTLDPTREQLKAFLTQYPDNQPVCMINFIKFKAKVEDSDLTGEEQYKIYGEKPTPFLKKWEARLFLEAIQPCT